MRIKNLSTFILVITLFFGFNINAQVNMGDAGFPQSNPIPCLTFSNGATPNFFDNGGSGGNYTSNYNDTIVFCPDLNEGTKVSLVYAINAGFSFDVDASDSIYVYDGPSTSAPLLGTHNSATDPNGFTYTASWANPTGCLTVVFISNGVSEGAGWQANVSCGNINQPFEPHVEAYINGVGPNAINPVDTGFVDICFGDSVLLIAKPIFPNSFETTGFGYSQDINTNIDFEWNITDGGTYPNNDSIWFYPPTRNGFYVDLNTTDMFPQSERIFCKIRVSQLPSFLGTGPIDDQICLGDSTVLLGGVTPTDTVGINIPEGSFQLGGSFAGLTYLPDGSGAQYQAPIEISGFPSGSTINSLQDLNQVCITMEHSFLGDLEIALECPNGTQVSLVNSYDPGFIPGGFNGGGTYLGDADDDSGNGVPGIGWEYCFSEVFNDWGNMGDEQDAGNTVGTTISGGQSMNPDGVYLPDGTFGSLVGCPVNGTWTIVVQDNLGIDDGYIFEWGLFFDASYFPGLGGYQNYVVDEFWGSDPTIISGQNDTLIVVMPDVPGSYGYTYFITDDFGCNYDTTVFLDVIGLPSIFNDTLACNFEFQVAGTVSEGGGDWSSVSPEVNFSNPANDNPLITVDNPGTYTVTYIDDVCQLEVSADIIFPQLPTIFGDTALCNLDFEVPVGSVDSYGGGFWTLEPGAPGSFTPNAGVLHPTLEATESFTFEVTFTDSVCGNSTSAFVEMVTPPTISVPDLSCNLSAFDITSTSYDGGVWTILDNPTTAFLEDTAANFTNGNTVSDPDVQVSMHGNYTIQFVDNFCGVTLTDDIYFPPYIFTEINDTNICIGVEYQLGAFVSPYDVDYTWSTGATGVTSILVSEPGVYTVTIENECYTFSDDAVITTYLCDIEAPNIISLSSTNGNNTWFVESDGIADFECVIVNRWGNLIYEYFDINGGWNGQDMNGRLVEEGVYFYNIKAKAFGGEEVLKHGFITVVH